MNYEQQQEENYMRRLDKIMGELLAAGMPLEKIQEMHERDMARGLTKYESIHTLEAALSPWLRGMIQ